MKKFIFLFIVAFIFIVKSNAYFPPKIIIESSPTGRTVYISKRVGGWSNQISYFTGTNSYCSNILSIAFIWITNRTGRVLASDISESAGCWHDSTPERTLVNRDIYEVSAYCIAPADGGSWGRVYLGGW